MIYRTIISSLFLLGLCVPTQGQDTKPEGQLADTLETFIEDVRQDWQVPGLSVIVVNRNGVLFQKGFGTISASSDRAVDNETMFNIGSNTKAFTALLALDLVEEGTLDLDKPIKEYMPDLVLYDEILTNSLTTRDVLSQRSGLIRHDLVWRGAPISRTEIFEALRYLEPEAPIRSKFTWNNMLYVINGDLIERITGKSWRQNVKERLLDPLGMDASVTALSEVQAQTDNHITPHTLYGDQPQERYWFNVDTIAPSSAIYSNALDMANYMQFQLNQGNFEGNQLIDSALMKQQRTPYTIITNDAFYGLGVSLADYKGTLRMNTGGSINGAASISLFPEAGFGVMVMTNMYRTGINNVIINTIADQLLGVEAEDWQQPALAEFRAEKEAAKTAGAPQLPQKTGTQPTHSLADYAGRYTHPAYGTLTVEQEGEQLHLSVNELDQMLTHHHYDHFLLNTSENAFYPPILFQFHINERGDIDQVSAPLEPKAPNPVVFVKQ